MLTLTLTPMFLLQIQQVVPDSMLLQLLVAWLSPRSKALTLASAHAIDIESVRPWSAGAPKESPDCCREAMGLDPLGCPLASLGSTVPKEGPKSSSAGHAPLKACLSAQRHLCLNPVVVRARENVTLQTSAVAPAVATMQASCLCQGSH